MTETEEQRLRDKIDSIIGHDGVDGTHIYYLTRVKEAFHVGTMTLDDFVEVDEEFTEQFVELFKNEYKKLIDENDQLRKALEEIRGITGIGYESTYRQAVEIASQALEPAKEEAGHDSIQ